MTACRLPETPETKQLEGRKTAQGRTGGPTNGRRQAPHPNPGARGRCAGLGDSGDTIGTAWPGSESQRRSKKQVPWLSGRSENQTRATSPIERTAPPRRTAPASQWPSNRSSPCWISLQQCGTVPHSVGQQNVCQPGPHGHGGGPWRQEPGFKREGPQMGAPAGWAAQCGWSRCRRAARRTAGQRRRSRDGHTPGFTACRRRISALPEPGGMARQPLSKSLPMV